MLSPLLLLSTIAAAAPVPPLDQLMADPDWVARSPSSPGWADDGRRVWYRRERADSELWDWWTVPVRGGAAAVVEVGSSERGLPPGGERSRDGRWRVHTVEGDVWVADRRGQPTQLTATAAPEHQARFLTDGRVAWRRGGAWFAAQRDGRRPEALVRIELLDNPEDDVPEGFLEEIQPALFPSLERDRAAAAAEREQARARAAADPTAPHTVYLGEGRELLHSSLSPVGDWLLIAHADEGPSPRRDPMPRFVTASGYVETEELRPKVGTTTAKTTELWLAPVGGGAPVVLDLDGLPERRTDRLAGVREGDAAPVEAPRPVWLETAAWSPSGGQLALQLHSHDHKDRWTMVVDLAALPTTDSPLAPTLVEHLHDPAWIDWDANNLGWLDDRALWFQSEADGFAHLYRWEGGDPVALTSGPWMTRDPVATRDGRWLVFRANRETPGRHEVYRVPTTGGPVERLTTLGGWNDFWLSPDENVLLIKHSEVLRPPELFVQPLRPGAAARQLTDTVEPAWTAVDWVEPELLAVPSTHHDGQIWTKVYRPSGPAPESGRPLVVFVHGAGYLQEVHEGWSHYFREAMFHSLLATRGYVVLSMDYRASEGYGRDWRTAIYRQMGHPELEDLADGVAWAVANAAVDPDRVGIYGGSYGGFLTFMALFRQPELWAAGAALRPVTDWSNYNDFYTRSILNTPADDPEAHRRSSPITHAEGLADPLLICHGMVDSNVPYQDSVRLAQRLIELRKTDWELASYPREGHGFEDPAAWWDEYRRVLALFEETIGPVAATPAR